VLAGSVRLFDGVRWIDASAGDFLFVPEGGVHGFRNESGEPASMLLLFTPGAPREDYFETLADAVRREAMTEEDWTAFYLRHDTFWVDRS
jgi:quercetin dioxygenase-like cupin family protein